MIRLAFYFFFAIVLITSCAVSAGTKKKPKVRSQNPRLIEATQQRTIPGIRDVPPFTTYRMLIVWNSTKPPETFFWRPEGDRWMTCNVSRVHKSPKSAPAPPAGRWYTTESIRLQDIDRGDTLELMPIPDGRDIMPAEARKKAVQSIYYYIAGGDWQTLPVSSFRKLPNLIMP